MNNRTAIVELFHHGRKVGVLSNITPAEARVNANALLREQTNASYVIIHETSDGPCEIMQPEVFLNPYFPLADITRLPRVPHTPSERLARHFQMAGAMDQDTVERLANAMRQKGVVHRFKFAMDFIHRGEYDGQPEPPFPMVVKAEDLQPGDTFGGANGISAHFVVDSVESASDNTVRVRCNDDTYTLWLGNEEQISIYRMA